MRIDYISLLVIATVVTNANSASLRRSPIDTRKHSYDNTHDFSTQETDVWHKEDERMLNLLKSYIKSPVEAASLTKPLLLSSKRIYEPNSFDGLAEVNNLARYIDALQLKDRQTNDFVDAKLNFLVYYFGYSAVARELMKVEQSLGADYIWKLLFRNKESLPGNSKEYLDVVDFGILYQFIKVAQRHDEMKELPQLVKRYFVVKQKQMSPKHSGYDFSADVEVNAFKLMFTDVPTSSVITAMRNKYVELEFPDENSVLRMLAKIYSTFHNEDKQQMLDYFFLSYLFVHNNENSRNFIRKIRSDLKSVSAKTDIMP
ncbi:hypothetical protein CCR75_002354 [Bremia lactucae]|uniref:Uncharacterized protein n=1 Tax=Bremia lactucae TaxID=4779 RepID=A0A976FMV1_BRELC|nr:hypothetical protein CCR75_002354 [Bremia lactucae]